jgi:hypothetical protein
MITELTCNIQRVSTTTVSTKAVVQRLENFKEDHVYS